MAGCNDTADFILIEHYQFFGKVCTNAVTEVEARSWANEYYTPSRERRWRRSAEGPVQCPKFSGRTHVYLEC